MSMKKFYEEGTPLEDIMRKTPTTMATIKSSTKQLYVEEDEFWKDCLEGETNDTKERRTSKNSENDQEIIYLTFNEIGGDFKKKQAKINNTGNISAEGKIESQNVNTVTGGGSHQSKNIEGKFKILANKLGLDSQESDRILTNSSVRNGKKKNASLERCNMLYEKSKVKNEINKMIIQKNFELKEKQLLSKCTFKPRTNSVKLIKDTSPAAYNVYDRNVYWKKNRNDKIEKGKALGLKTGSCSFKPQRLAQDIYNPEKNILNDQTARSHMVRLEKARVEAKTKIEKQYYPIKTMRDVGKYKRIASVSADNSICYVILELK